MLNTHAMNLYTFFFTTIIRIAMCKCVYTDITNMHVCIHDAWIIQYLWMRVEEGRSHVNSSIYRHRSMWWRGLWKHVNYLWQFCTLLACLMLYNVCDLSPPSKWSNAQSMNLKNHPKLWINKCFLCACQISVQRHKWLIKPNKMQYTVN